MLQDDFLWTNKYRPRRVKDTILPAYLKKTFQSFVDQKNVPTLLLTALAMLDEMGCDWLKLNGSIEGRGIDILRTKVVDFASTVSFTGGRKYIIMDEADYMNPQSVQPGLRGFLDDYSDNCGFIFTCNYTSKIIEPLRSRCSVVEFKIPKSEAEKLAKEFFKKACEILDKENVKYDKAVVAAIIQKFYPDWRSALGELQFHSTSGVIDTGALVNLKEVELKKLCALMKQKDFKSVRKWVSDNSDMDPAYLFSSFYDQACTYFKKSSVPALILLLAKYQYQVPFVANQEINTCAFFVEVMCECEFNGD
jgi:hypothetical protein